MSNMYQVMLIRTREYTSFRTVRASKRLGRVRDWYQIIGLVCALGCSDANDVTAPGATQDSTKIFARLELSYHIITLSLASGFDTMTLHTTARTPTGTPFVQIDSTSSPVIFRIVNNDPALQVTTQGQLIAQRVSSRVLVIATQKIGTMTMTDTAMVAITNLPTSSPAVASISLQPMPGDSAKVDCSGLYVDTLSARAFDALGQPVAVPVAVSYRSSDPLIATISPAGVIQGKVPGQVTISADAYIYGRGVRDSIRYTVGEPIVQIIWMLSRSVLSRPEPVSYASPADVVIGVGGSVNWMNGSTEQIDIVFDDSAAARPSMGAEGFIYAATGFKSLSSFSSCGARGSGNISVLESPVPFILNGVPFITTLACVNVGTRAFIGAGTYTYHSTLTGIVGRVIVR